MILLGAIYIPKQMPDISVSDGRLKVLLLPGTNMLSSFADAGHVCRRPRRGAVGGFPWEWGPEKECQK
jgi:hypothetical protein